MALEHRKNVDQVFSVRVMGRILLETDAAQFFYQSLDKDSAVRVQYGLTGINCYLVEGNCYLLFPDASRAIVTYLEEKDPSKLVFDIERI